VRDLPSIFTWSKALYTRGDTGVYEVLLGATTRIGRRLDKRQDGVRAPQSLDEVGVVVVVYRAKSNSDGAIIARCGLDGCRVS